MKINKLKVSHWFALFSSVVVIFVSLLIRVFVRNGKHNKNVIFYGHKLNGNLQSILNGLISDKNTLVSSYYLTLDKDYYLELKKHGVNVICLCYFSAVKALSMADIIISDHGLHSLILLKRLTNIKFVDVWHGIPFKGFIPKDFSLQRSYDEVWVASNYVKDLYVKKFGFDVKKVHVTGYARTDVLINRNINIDKLKAKYGIKDLTKKVVLFAPTWSQDKKGRNVFPFDMGSNEFIEWLIKVCEENSALCIVRTHLNTSIKTTFTHPDLYFIPSDAHPQTEELLLISDLMVCDWSSIAFDYLLLKRPTIFIDIPPPFKNGLSIPKSFRYGNIVESASDLFETISKYLNDPYSYLNEYGVKVESVIDEVYDVFPDGKSTERCHNRLMKLLS